MCAMIAELGMLGSGLYALFSGNIVFSSTFVLRGRRARVTGLILIAPLLLLVVGRIALAWSVQSGRESSWMLGFFPLIEWALIVLGLFVATAYVIMGQPSEKMSDTIDHE